MLIMAGAAAAAIRVKGKGGTPPQHGGWRPLGAARISAGHDDLDRRARHRRTAIGAPARCAASTRFHDPRTETLPVAEGDVAVLCHPDRHAPARRGDRSARRLGRDRRRRLRRRPGSRAARTPVRVARHDAGRRAPRCRRACRACWRVISPVNWRRSTRSTSRSTARPVRPAPAATIDRCRDARWRGTTATGPTTSGAAVVSCAGFPSRSVHWTATAPTSPIRCCCTPPFRMSRASAPAARRADATASPPACRC